MACAGSFSLRWIPGASPFRPPAEAGSGRGRPSERRRVLLREDRAGGAGGVGKAIGGIFRGLDKTIITADAAKVDDGFAHDRQDDLPSRSTAKLPARPPTANSATKL